MVVELERELFVKLFDGLAEEEEEEKIEWDRPNWEFVVKQNMELFDVLENDFPS